MRSDFIEANIFCELESGVWRLESGGWSLEAIHTDPLPSSTVAATMRSF
jgi:hypothetical protein